MQFDYRFSTKLIPGLGVFFLIVHAYFCANDRLLTFEIVAEEAGQLPGELSADFEFIHQRSNDRIPTYGARLQQYLLSLSIADDRYGILFKRVILSGIRPVLRYTRHWMLSWHISNEWRIFTSIAMVTKISLLSRSLLIVQALIIWIIKPGFVHLSRPTT